MASTSSTATTPSAKVSRFAAKSRFVIPKNKLSGSLVPIARGSKNGASDAAAEEGIKQVQRKTNWGPDLTQDAAVKKGRALAYQIRVEQIKQLLLGTLGIEDIDTGEPAHQVMDDKPSNYKLEKKALKLLELERREAIGEILKLDPGYKPPADYKPLLKEAKVPIPIKEHPGYDFLGLMFGPVNDAQKRLEKETGAKIRVFGTKAGMKEKVEVTSSEEPDMHKAYEELHVHVSGDTYEKVDAAVALIELLVTPVSANPASVSSTTSGGESVHASPSNANQTPLPTLAGFTGQPNPSAPLVSNSPLHASSLPFRMPSIFTPQPFISSPSGPQNPSFFPSGPQPPPPPQPYLSQPPGNPFVVFRQTVPTQQNTTTTSQFNANHQSILIPVRPHPPLPMASAGWSQPMLNTSTLSPGNMNPRPPAQNFPPSQPSFAPVNRPPINVPPPFGSSTHFQTGHSVSPFPSPPPMPASAPTQLPGPGSGVTSVSSGNASTFNATKPLVTTPRPQPPSSNDFTFQTNRPQILSPSPQVAPQRIYTQPLSPHPNISVQVPHGHPNPSFNPALHNPNPSPMSHGFQGPPQMHRAQTPPVGSPIARPGPVRHPIYPNPVSPHMPPQNLRPIQMHQQNYPPAHEPPRQRFLAPNHHQHHHNSFSFPAVERPAAAFMAPRGQQQVYDPFSPTAAPPPPNPQLNSRRAAKTEKQENDPEYEDLMASVGVK